VELEMRAVWMKALFFVLLFIFANSESQMILCLTNQIDIPLGEHPKFDHQLKTGIQLKIKGEFSLALEQFQRALFTARIDANGKRECAALVEIGLMNWNLGNMDESFQISGQAYKVAQKNSLGLYVDLAEKSTTIHKLYSSAKELRDVINDYEKSIELFREAIKIADEINSPEYKVKLLRQLSFVYDYQNKKKEFRELNEEALSNAKSINHSLESMRCLNNIGTHYDDIGNYAQALLTYEEAYRYANEVNRKSTASDLKNNISIIYKKLGEFDKAIDFLEDVLNIDRTIGDNSRISMALNNLGETYRRRGLADENEKDFITALAYFSQALTLVKTIRNKDAQETEVRVLNNIGTVYADKLQNAKSLSYFIRSLGLAETIKDEESIGMINTNIGIIYYNQGNFAESTKYFQKAIDCALKIDDHKTLWEAYLEIARSYVKQGRHEEAQKSLEKSILIIENIRSNIYLEELKASYLGTDKRIEAYQDMISLLVTLNQSNPHNDYDAKAFAFLERAKARAFLDQLETSQIKISQHVDFILQNNKTAVEKDITNILTRLLASGQSPEENKDLKQKLKIKENELENIKREIRSKSPNYANLYHPEIIELHEVQENLCKSHTAFIEFSVGKINSFAFIITQNTLQIINLPPRAYIKNLISKYMQVLSDKDNDDFSFGYELYAVLIKPGIDNTINNLIIIPDDILNYLPFETLVSDLNKHRWLIQDFQIAYVPSITALNEISERKKNKATTPKLDILAFGDPYYGEHENEQDGNDIKNSDNEFGNGLGLKRLKYSSDEIEKIENLFPASKITTFTRTEASEKVLKIKKLDDYKIIHFAAHSMINNTRPDHSYIALSVEENEDGILYASEIFNLALNSDLVTLSACQTGLGKLVRGEGIEGINRAFFYAGTSSVLMSLWPVNDQATSQLMERFYTHLNKKNSIMNSLREAKLELINSAELSHPFYWAGFIVSGKADHVVFPKNPSLMIIFGGITFVAFLLLIILNFLLPNPIFPKPN